MRGVGRRRQRSAAPSQDEERGVARRGKARKASILMGAVGRQADTCIHLHPFTHTHTHTFVCTHTLCSTVEPETGTFWGRVDKAVCKPIGAQANTSDMLRVCGSVCMYLRVCVCVCVLLLLSDLF